jgi:hypothetical protein
VTRLVAALILPLAVAGNAMGFGWRLGRGRGYRLIERG